MTNTRTLPQIAKAIKALEKKSIQNVIEIGKLLHEAFEKCEHGEYMGWLKSEFGWSHNTSLHYRNVYALTQNRKNCDFAKLDISITALYLVARFLLKDSDPTAHATGDAILKAAKKGRVSYQMARDIIKEHEEVIEPDPPPVESDSAADPDETSPPDEELPSDDESADEESPLSKEAANITSALTLLDSFTDNDSVWSEVMNSDGGKGKEVLQRVPVHYRLPPRQRRHPSPLSTTQF